MEKYGIDYELLDYTLDVCKEQQKLYESMKYKISMIEHDRDTWKKVAEKEADILRDINYKLYNEDRVDFENYFYQQAQKGEL